MKKYLIVILSSLFILISFSFHISAAPSSGKAVSQAKKQKAPLMIPRNWNWKKDVSGWWMSEKLDGVRGYWTGEKLIFRSGRPFNAPSWFTEKFPPFPLDGELWMGRGTFSELSGLMRRKNPDKRWEKVGYFIFDAPKDDMEFEKRLELAREWFKKNPASHVKLIEQEVCKNNDYLLKKLAKIEAEGGEGVMLRRPKSKHIPGRSSNFLRVKSFKEDEAEVVKHIPGSGKHKGRLGALMVKMADGRKFSVGTGFSDKERESPPPLGSMVVFKYQGLTKSGTPRFASFLRVKENTKKKKTE